MEVRIPYAGKLGQLIYYNTSGKVKFAELSTPYTTELLVLGKDDLLSSYFNKKNKKVGLLSALKGAQEWVGLTFKNKKSF